jgi:Uma2 family endonuclease
MTAVLNPPTTAVEGRVLLRNISWQTYERILEDLADCSVPHLTYDRGDLEIMSPTAKHEFVNRIVEILVSTLSEEMEVEISSLGSTTFKLEEIERGFEPNSCFYFANEALVRGKERIDPTIDPPPDLVFEVDITSSSIDKHSIFAHFKVPEVWRYDGETIEILKLVQGSYVKVETSSVLPFITAAVLTSFVAESLTLSRLEWMKKVREWARQQKASS